MARSEQNQNPESQTHDEYHQQSSVDQDTAISSRGQARVNPNPIPPSRPQGRRGLIFLAVALLVLVAVIIGTLTPLHNLFLSSPSPSTQLPASPPKTITILFDSTVGSVTFKGKTYPHSFNVRLGSGAYAFTWRGEPFEPISCTATVPFSLPQDTCGSYESQDTPNSESITFVPNLSYLSGKEQAALLRQIQAALATMKASETVLPGEHYALFSPSTQLTSIVQATQPLHATLSFHLDTDPHSSRQCGINDGECGLNGLDCRLFCTSIGMGDYTQSTATELRWHMVAVLYSSWDYTTLDGKTVATGQPDSTSDVTGTEYSAHLGLTWNHAADSWHVALPIQSLSYPADFVSPSFIDLACVNAQELTTESYGVTKQTPATTVTWKKFAVGSNRAAGCLAVAQSDTDPQAAPANFLSRFGVLIAANAQAHSYFPSFPMADAHEQGIAAQIAAQSKIGA